MFYEPGEDFGIINDPTDGRDPPFKSEPGSLRNARRRVKPRGRFPADVPPGGRSWRGAVHPGDAAAAPLLTKLCYFPYA
ncbi:hypothetical protein MPPM_2741 [Methylorubrum populi]|uniref:Uncharacterized protein n=1 Tax=Methylorubrum populi TaxID=223967 RepID=A0A160PFC6_9HYPH|nr:hypothetical protein MPPM_2741 [Methylorubrum populi]